eukprot:10626828-Karenia_brevis.AAC.1
MAKTIMCCTDRAQFLRRIARQTSFFGQAWTAAPAQAKLSALSLPCLPSGRTAPFTRSATLA